MSESVYVRETSHGRVIVGWSALALGAMCGALLIVHGAGEEGLRVVIRATARSSLVLFAATVPGFVADVSPTTAIGGGIGYLLIAAMALTSNDTAVRRLGRRRWRALHLTGLWVVFGIFTSSYLGRALHNPNYVPHATLLAAILILRLLPSRARVD